MTAINIDYKYFGNSLYQGTVTSIISIGICYTGQSVFKFKPPTISNSSSLKNIAKLGVVAGSASMIQRYLVDKVGLPDKIFR